MRTNVYRKNMPHSLRFMVKNDVKFLNQSKRTRVLITNFFRIEIHLSRANLWRFFDFQAITLDISNNWKSQNCYWVFFSDTLFLILRTPYWRIKSKFMIQFSADFSPGMIRNCNYKIISDIKYVKIFVLIDFIWKLLKGWRIP